MRAKHSSIGILVQKKNIILICFIIASIKTMGYTILWHISINYRWMFINNSFKFLTALKNRFMTSRQSCAVEIFLCHICVTIQVLGNQHISTINATSCSHRIAICKLHGWFLKSKVNRKTSRKLQGHGHVTSHLTTTCDSLNGHSCNCCNSAQPHVSFYDCII